MHDDNVHPATPVPIATGAAEKDGGAGAATVNTRPTDLPSSYG